MDKVTLTKEQLNVLMAYIRSRGFVEPFVILEILDHFACKVEELMNGKPGISFEEAMQQAHRSFGVAGFAPMVQAYYAALKKKYNAWYRQKMKQTLKSIVPMSILVALGIVFYKSCIWADIHNYYVLDTNIIAFTILVVVLGGMLLLKNGPFKRENPILNTILNLDKLVANGFIIGIISSHYQHFPAPISRAIICLASFVFMYNLLRIYCLYYTKKFAQHDIDASEQYYDTLMSA